MDFLGYNVPGHIVAASCPATESIENVIACQTGGASSIIMKSTSSHRSGDHITRTCYLDETGFWAASGFDREILPLSTSIKLISNCDKKISVPIIASITEPTLDIDQWLESCLLLEKAGALGLQLDFFYIDSMLTIPDFSIKFIELLRALSTHVIIPIMPKLNIGLPVTFAAYLLKEAGIHYVSLLDSIRSPAPLGAGEMNGGVSAFGHFMFPITRQYTTVLAQSGFNVCAGGGVENGTHATELIRLGASTVQVATEVLLHGFSRFAEIESEIAIPDLIASRNNYKIVGTTFNASKCNGCGACRKQTFCVYAGKGVECEGCKLCINLCRTGALSPIIAS